MREQRYVRIDFRIEGVSDVVEKVFAAQDYVTVGGLRRVMEEVLGQDPIDIVGFDTDQRRRLRHGGSQDGIVFYPIGRGEKITPEDYYTKGR